MITDSSPVRTTRGSAGRALARSALLLGVLLLCLRPMWAQQEEKIATADQTLSPYFFVKSKDASVDRLPLQSTSAEVHIAGVIADVAVTQVYKNEGKVPLEAV